MNKLLLPLIACAVLGVHYNARSMHRKSETDIWTEPLDRTKILLQKKHSPKNTPTPSPRNSPRSAKSMKKLKKDTEQKRDAILNASPVISYLYKKIPFMPQELIRFDKNIQKYVFNMVGSLPLDAINEVDKHPSLNIPEAAENIVMPLLANFNTNIQSEQKSVTQDVFNHLLALALVDTLTTPKYKELLADAPRKLSAALPSYKASTIKSTLSILKITDKDELLNLKKLVLLGKDLIDSTSLSQ